MSSAEPPASSAADPVLEVRDLTVRLPRGMERPHAIEDVSFAIAAGEVLCIVGESGSGKSVTANTIMGLLPSAMTVSPALRRAMTMPRPMPSVPPWTTTVFFDGDCFLMSAPLVTFCSQVHLQ